MQRSLSEEVSKNRSIRVSSCIVPRNAVQSSPATQGGFTNWCRASITASASPSILSLWILPSATRHASRAKIIPDHYTNLVCFSFIPHYMQIFTIFKIIRDFISRCHRDELLYVYLTRRTHDSCIYTIGFIISPLRASGQELKTRASLLKHRKISVSVAHNHDEAWGKHRGWKRETPNGSMLPYL